MREAIYDAAQGDAVYYFAAAWACFVFVAGTCAYAWVTRHRGHR